MFYNKKNIIPILIVAILIATNPPWIIWSIGDMLGFVLAFVLFVKIIPRLRLIDGFGWLLFCSILFVFVISAIFRGWHTSSIFYLMTFLSASVIKLQEYSIALKHITNIIAWIIVISLPAWFINTFIIPLPIYSLIDLSSMKGGGTDVIMENYILFVRYKSVDFFRFYSVFDEPGVLGTLSAFILYGNKFNLRDWRNIAILIGGFFTYSMAFYILVIIGFTIINFKSPKRMIVSLAFMVPLIVLGFRFLEDDIAFQDSVVDRMFNRETSSLVEERTNIRTNQRYDMMMNSIDCVFGLGYDKIKSSELINGSSYKLFILEYGLIGLLIMIIAYIYIMQNRRNIYNWGAYAIIFLSFLQRPKIWTSTDMLIFGCMVAGVTLLSDNKQQKHTRRAIAARLS